MNFDVIEGEHSIVSQETYDEIKKEYISQEFSVEDIKEIYELNNIGWRRISRTITEETGFSRENLNGPPSDYYYFNEKKNCFIVRRDSEEFKHDYVYVKTEEEARRIVEFLQANDWDKSKMLKWLYDGK